jgi:hypothetical protein
VRQTWLQDLKNANGTARPMVEGLLHRAINTLNALPDPDVRYFQIGSAWPTYARRYLDAYDADDETEVRWRPTPHDVTVYLVVLRWTRGFTPAQWRICAYMAEGCSPEMVGDYMRLPTATVVENYDRALDLVVAAAMA